MLGGADIQISAIVKAKELGYRVITCDYLPDNPGHKLSDEYHNVSTTDKEKVLELAQKIKIDGISAYASDPAALTAAFVSDHMGIPGNPYKSVLSLSDKLQFRAMQREEGLPVPAFFEISDAGKIMELATRFKHGIIIKPVDTSGSKGVFRFSAENKSTLTGEFINAALTEALGYSRAKVVIAEEFIPREGFLMSGDFLIEEGIIKFMCFGDVHFNTSINGLVPRSISLPASRQGGFFTGVQQQLQKLVTRLQIKTGVFNADVIEAKETGEAVIIDIGARNGGNMFNDIIFYHSGVNLIELSMKQCCGEPVTVDYDGAILGFYAHNVIHSQESGILESIDFSPEIESMIIYRNIGKKPGDRVERFTNSSFRIGLVLLKAGSFEQLHAVLNSVEKHVNVRVKK